MGDTMIRASNGEVIALGDHGDYPLWSAAAIGSAQTKKAVMFVAKSGALPGSNNGSLAFDEAYTNVPQANGMPDTEEMMVFSVAFEADTDCPLAALQDMLDYTYCELKIGGSKAFVEALARHLPAGGGIDGFTTATSTTVVNNGVPHAGNLRQLAVPHLIEAGSPYSFELSWPHGAMTMGTADQVVRVILRGFRKRKVE